MDHDRALTDEALISVAELLRRYHDAVASFDPGGHQWPHPLPHRFRQGLVSHNDPNLDNVVFDNGRAVALIDFDLASPGSIAWAWRAPPGSGCPSGQPATRRLRFAAARSPDWRCSRTHTACRIELAPR